MRLRAPLTAGTVLSLAVVSVWPWTASLTIGPAVPLHLTRDLPSDYAQLAAGNGAGLFAAVAAIYALCLLASGWRKHRRPQRAGGGG